MNAALHKADRNDIETGDMLVWRKDNINGLSNFILGFIRFVTSSEFAHVGVAFRAGARIFVIEATSPRVRIYPLNHLDEFYLIKMDVKVTEAALEWMLDKVGCEYSMSDGIRAVFGNITEDDDSWQCAELCNKFYKQLGRDYGDSWTPTKLVNATLEEGRSISLVSST